MSVVVTDVSAFLNLNCVGGEREGWRFFKNNYFRINPGNMSVLTKFPVETM